MKRFTAHQLPNNLQHALDKKKLRGFSPLVNYTDRAIATGQRS
jgi:hypothetical protein